MSFKKQISNGCLEECKCGNPEYLFPCACKWMAENPGKQLYICEYCGIYRASKPQCSECGPEQK